MSERTQEIATPEASLRIAMVGPFAPFRGGIAQFNDRLLQELRQRGHEVLPITFSRQYPELLFPGTSQFDDSRPLVGAARVIDSMNPLSWRSAARAIAKFAPTAAMAAYWTPHLAPALGSVLHRSGAPAFGLVHNILPHAPAAFSKVLARRFLKTLSGVLTLADPVTSAVRSLGFDGPIAQSPHPVYDHFGAPVDQTWARESLGLPGEGPILLCLGLVRHYKGFDSAVEALGSLRTRHPNATLVIAGEAYDDELERQLSASMPGLVRHNRYIPDQEVSLYYSAADALVLPYRSATQSGALAAAGHFALPVVTTDVGGLADPVRQFSLGIVVSSTAPEVLGRAMGEVLIPDAKARFAAGAREMARTLSWSRFARELETLISS